MTNKWRFTVTLRTGTRAYIGRDPFNQNSNRSDREKVVHLLFFSKLFRLDRTDPLSFGPKFPEILVERIFG